MPPCPPVTARTVGEVFTELSAGDSNLGQIPQNHFFFVNALTHAATAAQQKFFYAEVPQAVIGEEVDGEHRRCLGVQELPPRVGRRSGAGESSGT